MQLVKIGDKVYFKIRDGYKEFIISKDIIKILNPIEIPIRLSYDSGDLIQDKSSESYIG